MKKTTEEWVLKPKTDDEVKFLQIFKLAQKYNIPPMELAGFYALEGLVTIISIGIAKNIGKDVFKELFKAVASLDLPLTEEEAKRYMDRIDMAEDYLDRLYARKKEDDEKT